MSTLSSQTRPEPSDGVMIQPSVLGGSHMLVSDCAMTVQGPDRRRHTARKAGRAVMTGSIRHDDRVSRLEVRRRSGAFECRLVVKGDRLDAGVALAEDADAFGICKVFQA